MKNNNKNFLIIILFSVLFSVEGIAQETMRFSLKEALVYALENNYDIINAATDVEIARKKVKENLAIGLPQISGKIGYNNNLVLPTTLLPGEVVGQPGKDVEVQFGTQHNANWGAELSQLIFSGTYLVGVMAARAYVDVVESSFEKSEIGIKNTIAKSYYPVIILQENKKVFDSTLLSLNNMLYETEAYHKSGFIEDTDVDQLKLLISDMETTITNINNQLQIATNMLKYQLGLDANVKIEVTDKMDDLLAAVDREFLLDSKFDYSHHVDYKILKGQRELSSLQLKLNQSEYWPSLVGFYSYNQSAFRDEFNFFTDNKWYNSQVLGFQLDVPILSSGNRKFKVQQAKLELEKMNVSEHQLQQGLSLRIKTVKADFNNAYLIYMNRKMSVGNAEKIYQKTEIKYKEGLSTSLDLSQTYNQFLNSQISYLTSILDLLIKKADLEKELTKVDY
ncbi:MAG: TolC family protein [Chlorobi bacterium]|nr:TolC family protein [Chlorobiota bacterium]